MAQPPSVPDRSAIIAELDRVLESRAFSSARRSQRFLRYLVEHSLAYPGVHVKEYSIALDVFERHASYDPSVDATVRVEAGRLRSRLRDYYADERHDPAVMFEIPKGSYTAIFITRPVTKISSADAQPHPFRPMTFLDDCSPPVRWMLVAAFIVGGLLGFLAGH